MPCWTLVSTVSETFVTLGFSSLGEYTNLTYVRLNCLSLYSVLASGTWAPSDNSHLSICMLTSLIGSLALLIWTWLQSESQDPQPHSLEASSTEVYLSGKEGFGLRKKVYLHDLLRVDLSPSQREKREGVQ